MAIFFSAQRELLNRAQANGLATQGKYEGNVDTSAASQDNFVPQYTYWT